MKYDLNQIKLELAALNRNKDMAFQQYHKICGAVEILESMAKFLSEEEEKAAASCDLGCASEEPKNEDLVQ